jgi:DNA-binding NtrC family response regulator
MAVSKHRLRDGFAPAVSDFAWDAATVATLRHATLPWFGTRPGSPIDAVALHSLERAGEREAMSLVAQFAAHCAFLQFAAIPVTEFAAEEWAVVRRRGSDSRLVRVAARERAEAESPFEAIAAFAAALGAVAADAVGTSWRRPEAIFIALLRRLVADAAADLSWVRAAAAGAVLSPGPDALRSLWCAPSATRYAGPAVRHALTTLAAMDTSATLVVLDDASPVVAFSALRPFAITSRAGVAAAAEELVSALSAARHIVVVPQPAAIDAGSRQVIDIAHDAGAGVWIYPDRGEPLPPHELFVIGPRLSAAKALRERIAHDPAPLEWLEAFVAGRDFDRFIEGGEIPKAGVLAAVEEPRRSWIAALALLGDRIDRELAGRYLERFFFSGTLEELIVESVTGLDEEAISFADPSTRASATAHIPEASRAALCSIAAELTTGATAALLYAEAGDTARAAELLEDCDWRSAPDAISVLSRLPRTDLPPRLAAVLCEALIADARYSDALEVVPRVEETQRDLLLARIERRVGDYETALRRVRRCAPTFDALVLEAELLRIDGDASGARACLLRVDDKERPTPRWQFEAALVALDVGEPCDDFDCGTDRYLASRLSAYRDLLEGDYAAAAAHAQDAYTAAANTLERIDAALDRVFATFSAGEWEATRAAALETLAAVDESQGDRAAAGILFTLAYLAADDGQWNHADARLRRIRTIYDAGRYERGLRELALVDAQLALSRGRFDEASAHASQVLRLEALAPQIREAAALIVDTVDWLGGRLVSLRSTGRSGNRELTRRHQFLRDQLEQPNDVTASLVEIATARSQKLEAFRCAVAFRHDDIAARLASELGAEFDRDRQSAPLDVRVLRAAALSQLPSAGASLPVAWNYAVRNRFGQWSQSGTTPADDLDRILGDGGDGWIKCSERELLFVEGCEAWPADSREALAAIVRLRAENARLQRLIAQHDDAAPPRIAGTALEGFVGESPVMREVYERIQRVAVRDVVVLVLGESGTGKELVARAIHRQSMRRSRGFTAINCAALPENLIESELFGSIRGAFTGADRDRPGLIETTDGGTLFLDELGEMPLAAQAKLLRFLQEGEFRRVGDTTVRTADVRIVCATNRDLEEAVEAGRFREDLFYRVHGVDVSLPPLRDRGADIVRLATHFLDLERERHRSGPARLSDDVESVFLSYRWPGNVRELQNTVRAAHAIAGDSRELTLDHLPNRIRSARERNVPSGSYQDAVARFRRDLIERSLAAAGGNQNRAAAMLQISRQALAYQIRELGIMVRRPKRADESDGLGRL